MLAGILIAIVVVAGLAFALPWVSAQRAPEADLEGDPTERFSNSVRILHRDLAEERNADEGVAVSTPLTRRADLHELRMIARQAARRRLIVVCVLSVALLTLGVLGVVGVVPGWAAAIPGGLLGVFLGIARVSVVAMHKDLDARAAAVVGGFAADEETTVIDLSDFESTESVEISVDLSMPTAPPSPLWEPIPVTPATYVSQPLMPRSVRTIDLSAPVAPVALVPTADNPNSEAADIEEPTSADLARFRPRAVGE